MNGYPRRKIVYDPDDPPPDDWAYKNTREVWDWGPDRFDPFVEAREKRLQDQRAKEFERERSKAEEQVRQESEKQARQEEAEKQKAEKQARQEEAEKLASRRKPRARSTSRNISADGLHRTISPFLKKG